MTQNPYALVQLRELDDVAYVRFASVYKNFREAKDFGEILERLSSSDGEAGGAGRTGGSDAS